MSSKTRDLTLSALFSALSIVSMLLASIWPTGQLGFAAFASLFVAAAIVESGIRYGVCVYIVSSALAALLLPVKTVPLIFALFFGYYPVVKRLAERIKRAPLRWVPKLVVFNAALTVLWFLVGALTFDFADTVPGTALTYLAGNAVFILFDYGFSKVIALYGERVSKKNR